MNKEDKGKLIDYWGSTAKHDHKTMQSLFDNARYDASLFFGHIVLEKILKALVVQSTEEHALRTHNLVRLREIAGISLDEDEMNLLREVNEFNMEARYPEWKMEFYKRCNKKYTEKYFFQINVLYKKLCQELKRNK
jgi:HEPN domain-containing protein